MSTLVPYVQGGRSRQKARTQDALVAAARELMAAGADPSVEEAAAHAGVSRTTAYRYFPRQRDLLVAAYPQTELSSLLPDPAPEDLHERLDLVMTGFLEVTLGWEPQLRSALRLSLEAGTTEGSLRRGRAIGWIEEALLPLTQTHPDLDRRQLALAIRSATGIESYVWLVDVGGVSRKRAAAIVRANAHAILEAATASRAGGQARRTTS